jgi:uncharacterized membrane protein
MPIFDQAKTIIEYLARDIEFAAALIIGIAAVEATVKALSLFARRGAPPIAKTEVRLTLGRWLAVGLEFELAADILRTAVTPSWKDIEQLVAIAALRTALIISLNVRSARSRNRNSARRRPLHWDHKAQRHQNRLRAMWRVRFTNTFRGETCETI